MSERLKFRHLLTLRGRMLLAMLTMALSMALLGGGGHWAVSRAQSDLNDLARQQLPATNLADKAQQALLRQIAFDEVDVVLNYALPPEANRLKDQAVALHSESEQVLGRLMQLDLATEDRGAVMEATSGLQAYQAKVFPVLMDASTGKLASVIEGKRRLEGGEDLLRSAQTQIASLAARLASQTERRVESMAQRNATAGRGLSLMVPVALIVVLPLMWSMLRSVEQPLRDASELAGRISRGDLSRQPELGGRDEAAVLMRALGQMQERLRAMVGGIHEAANQVASTATAMALGNTMLATRTERASASLDRSSSNLNGLTEKLCASSVAVGDAGSSAKASAMATREGAELVQHIATLMTDLTGASKRVADIAGVVDGMARRTSILALNAGVEAARAGEHGRGFAVVAQEVRALASRSEQSALEIARLVEESVSLIKEGSDLSGRAGALMSEVAGSSATLSARLQDISHDFREHSKELEEVSHDVTQVDRLVRENAALVERSALSSAELKGQAIGLEGLIGVFRLKP